MGGIPATVITGSIAYLVLGVVLVGLVQAARGVGKLNKDDAGYVQTTTTNTNTIIYTFLVEFVVPSRTASTVQL